jgi:hypothetical protein
MVRVALLLLSLFVLSVSSYGEDLRVCVINSYQILPAKRLEQRVKSLILKEGYSLASNDCRVKIVIGTPALVKELQKAQYEKLIFTFVLFPEELPIPSRGVYGVRIFPLPERTIKAYAKKSGKKSLKVAVPVSKKIVRIAKKYLPKKYFNLLIFKRSPVEVFEKLKKYEVVYIFPDPKLLKLVNLLGLITYGKENGITFVSGLGDLKKYGVDFVQEVSYEKLADILVKLISQTPKEKILPCPVKEE